jgi:hypothetical protein
MNGMLGSAWMIGVLSLAVCGPARPSQYDRGALEPNATMSGQAHAALKIRLGQSLSELRRQVADLGSLAVKPDGEFYLPLHGNFTLGVEAFPYLRGRHFRFVEVSGYKVNDRPVVRHLLAWSAENHLDDWDSAVDEAEGILAQVRAAQPDAVSVREHPGAFSTQQLAKTSRLLMSPFNAMKVDDLHTAAQARALFERLNAVGDEDQRSLRQPTYVAIDSLIGDRTIWRVSISKDFFYGNWESLQAPLRDVMRYEVDVLIAARDD